MDGLDTSVNTQEVAGTVQDTTPQETQNTEVNTETVETNVEGANGEVTTPQHEEKPKQSAEDNAKFAEMRRKHAADLAAERQKAKDDFIASQGYSWNGKPITTEAEYNKALAEQQEQQRIAELVEKNVPEEYAKEMVENKKFREQYEAEKQSKEQEVAKQEQFKEFLQAFPDVKAEEIPPEVWEEFDKGTPLKIAYTMAENAKLKAKLEAYEKGAKTEESNAKNAASSIGSVKGDNVTQPYFTREQVEKMSTSEVNKHWKSIVESQKRW